MDLIDRSLRRQSKVGHGGRIIIVSNMAKGANPLVNWDQACLFCNDCHGNQLWINDDLPADLQAFDRHDDLVALIKADPSKFVPADVPYVDGVMFANAD